MNRLILAAAVALAVPVTSLGAQVVDSTARLDSLARDTTDYTALFLKAQQDARRTVPVAPRIGAAALLPPHTRFIIDRDSISWHNAETVGDVLTKVPGLFLLRGGWAGRPELPAYQAHGATSAEYVVDGLPYLPLGQDSLMVDPSLLPLSFIDRIEVERLPGKLRVFLFTRRHDRSVPYSRIGIASGDLQIARYQGQLEKRSRKGIGFAAAFDHLAVPVQRGNVGDYSDTQGLLRLDYVPSARFGAEVQMLQNSPDREPILTGGANGDTLSQARHGTRRDISARVFFSHSSEGLGPRLDLIVSRSNWTDNIEKDSTRIITVVFDSLTSVADSDTTYSVRRHTRGVTQVGTVAGYRLPAASLEAALFWRSAWTPLDVRARAGASLTRWFTASAEAVYLKHDGSRTSRWLTARAGVVLPLGFSAGAVWRRGSEVALPAILADEAQDLDDRSISVGWRSRFAEIEASYTSNAGFRPASYAQYDTLASIAASGRTDWITVNARISPRQWIILDGWYSTTRGVHPEGQPPTHSMLNATIQSKFLPTFKSGIFNLKLQASMENWGSGVLGQDRAGAPVPLAGVTCFRGYIGLEIGAFTAYYDRYNMQGNRCVYVPGLSVPGFASTFGVRWEFIN